MQTEYLQDKGFPVQFIKISCLLMSTAGITITTVPKEKCSIISELNMQANLQ